jgi:hypothetical protein
MTHQALTRRAFSGLRASAVCCATATLLVGMLLAQPVVEMCRLSGIVLDTQGRPIPDATVAVLATAWISILRAARPVQPLATRTDRDGRYTLAVPRALGEVTVIARRAGFTSAHSPVVVLKSDHKTLPTLRLLPGLTLSGRVIDGQRRPLAGVVIRVAEPAAIDTSNLRHSLQTVTPGDGSFTLSGLDAAHYDLRAQRPSYADWSQASADVSVLARRALEIVLSEGVYLTGVVQDDRGHALAGVELSELSLERGRRSFSDATGRFRLGPYGDQLLESQRDHPLGPHATVTR